MPLILLCCAGGLFGQTPESKEQAPRTVTVHGTGTVKSVPDRVRINVQVNTRGESASAAMAEAGKRTRDILAQLKAYGVDEKDIQTSRVSVSAVYDYEKRIQPPPIVGYTGVNEFTVLFTGKLMDRIGEFLDRAVTAGAANFGGLVYESSQQQELEREALRLAAGDARARAEVLAKELGTSIGKVLSITENINAPVPIVRSGVMEAAAAGAPVQLGQYTVTAQAQVTFELK